MSNETERYNSRMNHKTIHILLVALAAVGGGLLGGCGQGTGFLIKPVPLDERLVETVVEADGGWFVSDKIAIIEVEGMILNARGSMLTGGGENPVSLFVEKLDRAEADPSVKAVVLRINSPGGGVNASDMMYERLLQFKKHTRVPVVAIIEDVGASGAYFIASGADTILAHPTSITGSIGVIIEAVSFAGTMRMLGIDMKAITSGEMKDMGSPFKPLDPKDEKVLKALVDEFYGRFIKVVCDGRPKLTREEIVKLADGRVYSGPQAKANGLVDDVCYLPDAISLAKKLSKAKRVEVVMYSRPFGYRASIYSQTTAPMAQPQINMVNVNAPDLLELSRPQMMYLWTGRN
jgi:protease-4